jgi:1L-myo-inositol 1-phosphate cytidylyltransferase / CDP-L-myo-inositol myo-inositolphosphotransferase
MLAVILAAGDGGRLGDYTAGLPKPLVSIAGRPLISFTIEALAEAGVEDLVVVVGYREQQLRAALVDGGSYATRITFVSNARFDDCASLSLRSAREAAGSEPFLLLMSDHLLSTRIITALLSNWRPGGPSLIATDASEWPPEYVAEATKVRFVPGTRRIAEIGKQLLEWDALDTGAFLLAPEVWAASEAAPEDCELSEIFRELARGGMLEAVDVSGESWYDVDTIEDLEAAGRIVAGGRP